MKRLRIAATTYENDLPSFEDLGAVSLQGNRLTYAPAGDTPSDLQGFVEAHRNAGESDAELFKALPSRINYYMGSCAWDDETD